MTKKKAEMDDLGPSVPVATRKGKGYRVALSLRLCEHQSFYQWFGRTICRLVLAPGKMPLLKHWGLPDECASRRHARWPQGMMTKA
jgi:hypothetical protein